MQESKLLKRATILLDMDGTVSGWVEYVLANHFPRFENIQQLNRHPEREDLIKTMYSRDPDIFRSLPVIEGAKSFFQQLIHLTRQVEANGHKLELSWLTAKGHDTLCSKQISSDKRSWLTGELHEEALMYGEFTLTERSSDKQYRVMGQLPCFNHLFFVDDFKRTIDEVKTLGTRVMPIWFRGDYGEVLLAIKQKLLEENYL